VSFSQNRAGSVRPNDANPLEKPKSVFLIHTKRLGHRQNVQVLSKYCAKWTIKNKKIYTFNIYDWPLSGGNLERKHRICEKYTILLSFSE
jgi:hypothetical protein